MNFLTLYAAHVRTNPLALFGTAIVLLFLVLAVFAPLIAPYDPITPTDEYRTPPSLDHLFGTDPTGLDVFSRVVYAARVDLTVGLAATGISLVVGVALGVVTGFYDNLATSATLRVADLLQAFPVFVLAMVIVAVAGASLLNVIIVIALLSVPVYMRLVRSKVLSFRSLPIVDAARCVGNSDRRLLLRYVLPNNLEPALVQASVNIGWAILLTASLSYIGAGIPVPTAEWGSMVSVGAPMILTGEPWAALFPGLAIGLCVFGFAAVGDALRTILNPERRHAAH
jgi:peptide/nickel transport system permease protein